MKTAKDIYKPPFYYDRDSQMIFDQEGLCLDVRSWGRLIGQGAHNLPEKEAEKIQDEFGKIVCDCLNDYFTGSDQQNKELRDENEELRKGLMLNGLVPNSKDAEIQRLTKELELCQTGNSDLQMEVEELKRGMQKLPFDTVADYELCKKAYQSSSEHAEGFAIKLAKADAELTRLRELLERSKPYFDHDVNCNFPDEKQCACGLDQLLTEIDNALNPKP